jgi:ribulose kinase
LCGIGYGLRQIIQAQTKAGATVQRIVLRGGAGGQRCSVA